MKRMSFPSKGSNMGKEAELQIQVCNSYEKRYALILDSQVWEEKPVFYSKKIVRLAYVSLPEDAFGNPIVFPRAIVVSDRKTRKKEAYILSSSYGEEGADLRVSEYTNSIFAKQKRIIRIYLGRH